MRRLNRFIKRLALALLALVLLAGVAGYVYMRWSLPEVEGVVRLTGLRAAVEVVRDAEGVPHIYAAERLDAFYALGYVHAQDRLWQMEFQRRAGLSPSYRQVVAVSDPDGGRFIATTGQSGHFLSPHYDDFLEDWQAGRYRPMRFTRGSAEEGRASALRLEP